MLVHASGWGEGAVDHERIDLRNLELEDAEQMFRNLLARVPNIPDETAQAAVEMTGMISGIGVAAPAGCSITANCALSCSNCSRRSRGTVTR